MLEMLWSEKSKEIAEILDQITRTAMRVFKMIEPLWRKEMTEKYAI